MRWILFSLLALLFVANSMAGEDRNGDKKIQNIEKVIRPELMQSSLQVPGAIMFIKSGALSPTCALMYEDQSKVELIGPDNDDSFPACRDVKRSKVFSLNGNEFLIFTASVEDPRAVFSNYFQVLYRDETVFRKCKNDIQLGEIISTKYSGNTIVDAKKSLRKLGCTR